MARGRSEASWAQTSLIAAMIANAFRGRGQRRMKPDDFNPFARKAAPVHGAEAWANLRKAFDKKKRENPIQGRME